MVERCRCAELPRGALARHGAALLEPAQAHVAEAASASSRSRTSADGKRARSTAGRSGRYGPQVVSREVVGRERPDEEPALGREHAARLGERRRARRSPSVCTTRRIVTASNQPLRKGRSSACASLNAAPRTRRSRAFASIGSEASTPHAFTPRRSTAAATSAPGSAADVEQPGGRAEALRDRELELRGQLLLGRAELVVALRHAIEDRRRRAVVRVSSRGRRPHPRRAAQPAPRRRDPIRRARGRGRRAATRRARLPRPRAAP